MKKKYLLFAAAAIGLAACSNDEGGGRTIDPDVISFSATIGGPVTRAASTATDLQDTYFVENEEVNVCSAATGETDYTYAVYKAGAASGTANAFTLKDGETALRWPSTGNIDLVAYHPSIITAATTEFAVAIDQSASDGYRGSDLMVADKLENKAKADGAPSFTFHHKLSKVVVNLTPGAGISDDDLANTTVRIKTIKTATASEGVWSAKSGESTEWIALGTGASTAAIIVPQSITGTTADPVDFIEIKVRSNPAVVWKTNATRTFAANTVSTYNLTVNMASISLTSTSITGWITDPTPVTGNQSFPASLTVTGATNNQAYTGNPVTFENIVVKCGSTTLTAGDDYTLTYINNDIPGTATILAVGKGTYAGLCGNQEFTITPKTLSDVSSTSPHLGWIIASDGSIYHNSSAAERAGKSPKAMILYLGSTGESSYTKGLAIALNNTGTQCWSNIVTGILTNRIPNNLATANSDVTGIDNTNSIIAASTTSAANDAKNYASTVTGCSQWFLPAIGQWIKVLNYYNANISTSGTLGFVTTGTVANSVLSTINAYLLSAGGESSILPDNTGYWTSSEYSSPGLGVSIGFSTSSGISIGTNSNSITHRVRPFLAF